MPSRSKVDSRLMRPRRSHLGNRKNATWPDREEPRESGRGHPSQHAVISSSPTRIKAESVYQPIHPFLSLGGAPDQHEILDRSGDGNRFTQQDYAPGLLPDSMK